MQWLLWIALLVCTVNCSCHRGGQPTQQSVQPGTTLAGSSIWNANAVPALADFGGTTTNLELGVKFRTDVAGAVNGIRFYKASTNTGDHVGHLWTAAGGLLGSATFTNETDSGWQQANFAGPIQIQPGVTYVASYWASLGHYSLDRPYFTKSVDNPPLHALADGVDGPNGVYQYPAGFPASTYQQSNYWVDVDFSAAGSIAPVAALSVTAVSPTSGTPGGGTQTTITGTGFRQGAVASFGGVQATSSTVISSTSMQAVSPSGTNGTVAVTVRNPDSATSAPFNFTDVVPPTIASASPPSGAASGGTAVTIIGANFADGAKVSFGGNAATSVVVRSTQITCATPAGNPGSVAIAVSNPAGQSVSLANGFSYLTPPPVTPPPSGNSLLYGMTPANMVVPAGWTLALKQSFDNGSISSNEYFSGMSLGCGFAHSGSCAAVGTMAGANTGNTYGVRGAALNSRELWVSWYEFNDAVGRINIDMFMVGRVLFGGGGRLTDTIFDWQPGASGCYYNCVYGQLSVFGEGQNGTPYPNFAKYLAANTPGWGAWHQWEAHMKNNTPGSNDLSALTDGLYDLFKDGVLVGHVATNLNGSLEMAQSELELGGVYSYYTYWDDSNHATCSPVTRYGLYDQNYGNFNSTNPCPNQSPSTSYNGVSNRANYGPVFKRYFDDIIILRKNATAGTAVTYDQSPFEREQRRYGRPPSKRGERRYGN